MKKNVLALSITAAVVGFGFAGSAQAMTGALGGSTTPSQLSFNKDGLGHVLFVPYYTAQADNSTLINLVNTDTTNGKAVKVRFRGAANSDDVFDFQVFLSPGDVWTANISKNAAGIAQLKTEDASCTKPAKSVLNSTPFVLTRLDPTLDAGQKANQTREGYIEIFNMGDIPPVAASISAIPVADLMGSKTAGINSTLGAILGVSANPLFTAIKHVDKVAPCAGAAWTALDRTNPSWNETTASSSTPRSLGLLPPTTGLMANWTIINVVGAAAWSNAAVAIQSVNSTGGVAGPATTGNVVYWPQTDSSVGAAINSFTADPLLRTDSRTSTGIADLTTAGVAASFYDLPDMSTPYTSGNNAKDQARELSTAIATATTTNEFLTDTTITGTTDWVFSMPTRRYSVALNYSAITVPGDGRVSDDGRRFSNLNNDPAGSIVTTGFYAPSNTLVTARQICVRNLSTNVWDREETNAVSTAVVISPSTTVALTFCGEASVLSINNGGIAAGGTGSLKAQVAVKDLDVGYRDGWMTITTPGATTPGLPILGSAFMRAFNGANSFGATFAHRHTR